MLRDVLLLLNRVDARLDGLGVLLAGTNEDVADLARGSVAVERSEAGVEMLSVHLFS